MHLYSTVVTSSIFKIILNQDEANIVLDNAINALLHLDWKKAEGKSRYKYENNFVFRSLATDADAFRVYVSWILDIDWLYMLRTRKTLKTECKSIVIGNYSSLHTNN